MYRVAVQTRLDLHIYGTGMPRHGDAFIYIYIRNQHGTEMPDFWPIQLETGALPNVPFPPITLVFIVSPRVESC